MQKKGLFTKIVISIVLVSFLTIGITSYDFDNKGIIAKVGKKKIYLNDFENTYRREVAHIKNAWGANIDESQLEAFGLRGIILKDMINNTVVDSLVESINLNMSDDVVVEFIRNHEMFQEEGKVFNREKFLLFLQNNEILEEDYIKKIKEDFLRTIFFKMFTLNNINYEKTPEKIYNSKFEKRAVNIMKISYDEITDLISPTIEELEKYYEEHKNSFVKPEQRTGNVLLINKEKITGFKISEEEVKASFDSLDLDERVTLKYLLFENIKDAQDLVQSGNIESIFSSSNDERVKSLINVLKSDIPFEIKNLLSTFEIGKASSIISTETGHYLVYLEKIQKISNEERENNYSMVKSNIIEDKKSEIIDSLILKVENELNHGKSLSEIVTLDDAFEIIKFVELNYENDLQLGKQVIDTIFNATINKATDFYEDIKGNYYSAEVLDIVPKSIQNFDDVVDLIRKSFETKRKFLKASEILLNNIKKEDSELKIEHKTFSNILVAKEETFENESNYSQGYRNEFIDNIFALQNVGDITKPIEDKSSVVIAVLKAKISPQITDQKIKEENIKKINKTIKNVLQDSMLEELIHYYSKIFEVEVNE